jgi:putative Mg2+ transporter-C (MgtC) family protein
VTWQDIALRLGAALLAGALIGYNRGTRGSVAGLRTTILMCLAATGAMIEANLMLSVTGKTAASFAVMDTLRFPLGILSGIGFIGAGAIVRRGKLVTGVTTAATMWLITVIGLVLGAGYLALGGVLTVLAFLVLAVLKLIEPKLYREHRAELKLCLALDKPSISDLRALVSRAELTITNFAIASGEQREVDCHLVWKSVHDQSEPPPFLSELSQWPGVLRTEWHPINAGSFEE